MGPAESGWCWEAVANLWGDGVGEPRRRRATRGRPRLLFSFGRGGLGDVEEGRRLNYNFEWRAKMNQAEYGQQMRWYGSLLVSLACWAVFELRRLVSTVLKRWRPDRLRVLSIPA